MGQRMLNLFDYRLSNYAGVMIYRLVECLGGESGSWKLISYSFGLKIKLFCLKKLIN